MTEAAKRLVLLYHGAKEGRGAWFDLAHRAVLTKAAAEPHHMLLELDQVKLDQVNPDLPAGKMGVDGRPAELPVMLRANFEQLLAFAETKAGKPAAAPSSKTTSAPAAPPLWSSIVVGSVVLASDNRDDGWWECVVVALEADKTTLRLKWRDFPELGEFKKPITRVGMLPQGGLR